MEVVGTSADFVAAAAAGWVLTAAVLEAAAAAGALGACLWLHAPERRPPGVRWQALLDKAARSGSRALCEWCLAHGASWCEEAVWGAARGGHVDLMAWLLDCQPPGSGPVSWPDVLEAAAEGCDLAAFQQLWAQGGPKEGQLSRDARAFILHSAVGSRTPDWQAKAEFALGQGCSPLWSAYHCAARHVTSGDAAVARFEWLKARGCRLDDPQAPEQALADALGWALEARSTPAVLWLLHEGPRPAADAGAATLLAARTGNVEALQALTGAGYALPNPEAAAEDAAEAGQQPVLAWLLTEFGERGLGGLGPELFSSAAASGSCELMAWLRSSGCAWDEGAWEQAADSGCEAALEWLASAGCPMSLDGRPYLCAAHNGDLRCLAALHRLGLPFGAGGKPRPGVFTRAVAGQHGRSTPLPALQALPLLGCPVDWAGARTAAQRRAGTDRGEVLAWVEGEARRNGVD
ncbi:hypothetical protein HYH03_007294 [Edaphochlamys debaryana]|uniref:Ankyrin repeat domain-containing protein n=1 Tax=Edaphochlamys debaryana TaxID=47281 RepID=A0A835Y3I4_9CHLO|nr:hypothetical protein HYH03_007294 [Edaphochlamys debaryana]|eukprot:KAG2494527.1 hypothetical protein HYH03_007294 [Edaphochlamys debaryana]